MLTSLSAPSLPLRSYAAEVRLSGGSAVVRMRTMPQAAAAIAALNGVVPDGGWQQLTVRAAESAEQRSSRISAINGRQGLGPPSPAALPPAGAAGALRRAQSGRSGSSAASLQCFTGALMGGSGADLLAVAAAGGRRSVDWPLPGGSSVSLDSRRSSMDAARCGRSSSDSGSEEAGGAPGNPAGVMQRMLLEAVLALVAQVEAGQLGLVSAARGALAGWGGGAARASLCPECCWPLGPLGPGGSRLPPLSAPA